MQLPFPKCPPILLFSTQNDNIFQIWAGPTFSSHTGFGTDFFYIFHKTWGGCHPPLFAPVHWVDSCPLLPELSFQAVVFSMKFPNMWKHNSCCDYLLAFFTEVFLHSFQFQFFKTAMCAFRYTNSETNSVPVDWTSVKLPQECRNYGMLFDVNIKL
jgi:hypothetical protein